MTNKMVLIISALIASSSAAIADDGRLTAEECAVWQREFAFAQSVDHHDATAFAAFVHPDAVFNAGTATPVRGRAAVVNDWSAIIAGKDFKISWRPRYVSIGGDPNVAISAGPYIIDNPDPAAKHRFSLGTFSTVWVRANANSPWMVMFDGGGPPPSPAASEAEAASYMANAPAACPHG